MTSQKPDTPKKPELDERLKSEKQNLISNLSLEVESAQRLLTHDRQELVIVGEKIVVRKKQLIAIVKQHDDKITELELRETRKKQDLADLDELIELKQTQLNDFNKAIKEAKADLVGPRRELAGLKEDIRDRRAYLYEQEDIIGVAIDEGNNKIKALYDELDGLNDVKSKLLSYNIDLEAKVSKGNEDYDALVKKLGIFREQFEEQRTTMSDSLTELREQINKEAEPLAKARIEATERLKKIELRELELDKQKQALEAYDQDLQARELRFKSNQAIYKF